MVTRELLIGLFETAYDAKMMNIISVYDLFLERILRRAGCTFDRIGKVVKFDGLKTTAGLFEVSEATIEILKDKGTLKRERRVVACNPSSPEQLNNNLGINGKAHAFTQV